MLTGGIDEETILHLMQLREKWFCGMVWGEKGSKTGFGGLLPCRLSARKIVEDHFSGSSSAVVEEDKDKDESWIREEASRLSATVQHLEEMESVLIKADRQKQLAEAKAETEKHAKEEVKRTRTEQEELARKKEDEGPESQAGVVQPSNNEAPSPVAADEDLDDIRSVTSDMSTLPSSDAGLRLERLILLHAEKHDLLRRINDLERFGVDDGNPRMEKLKSVMQKYERKILKFWEYGK
ncbi:hypothetical protein BJ165DRAFT_1006835 [Panaeolus papilionaceus]|nr:hypothetical protein BJ165DRAFT_1006835 [Panaeolus papilionaceus]